jgi:hypothetical protein
MKRLLLSLWLVGVVFSGHTPNLLQPQSPPVSTDVEARAALPIPGSSRLVPTSMPGPQYSGVERVTVRSLAMMRQDTPTTPPLRDGQIRNSPASLPNTEESSVVPAPEGKNEEAIWVSVIRGATVHSGPSVSAPTVRFYRVGTELNLIDYQQGWFQVSDPVTLQHGWIYEKYYLEAIRGPAKFAAPHTSGAEGTKAAPTSKTGQETSTSTARKVSTSHRKCSRPKRECRQFAREGLSGVLTWRTNWLESFESCGLLFQSERRKDLQAP